MQDIRIPVTVGGLTFKNPFFVASGPTTKTVRQLVRIEETGWAAASIKLSIDPAPYINRKPRYGLFEDRDALAFTTEKRLTFAEGLDLVREAKKQLHDLILFANITYAGDDGVPGWVNMAKEFEAAGVDVIELNMCCPNMSFNVELTTAGSQSAVKRTGASLGQQEDAVAEIVRAIKDETSIPLFVKLTPEGGRIAPIAKVLYEAGADAVSGTGSRMGMPLLDLEHPEKAVYHLQEEIGMSCYSGAWLKPLAQRDTYEMRKLCGDDIKIAATGGIRNWQDAVEMILCGGDILGICTETLISGYDIVRPMIKGLHEYMERHGYKTVGDFRGLIVPEVKTAQEVTIYGGYARVTQPKLSAPCKAACPYHVPAQAYVQMVSRGDFAGAYDIITENGLLQGACAYVCPHPCEDACVRGAYGKPVRIRELKRYVLEKGQAEGWNAKQEKAEPNGHRIAVAGGGSAGISAAWELAKAGYAVTLMEKRMEIGGMLRALCQEGSLPVSVLDGIKTSLVSLGVSIRTGLELDRDFTVDSLMQEGYEAVLITTGGQVTPPEGLADIDGLLALIMDGGSLAGMRVIVLGDGLFELEAALCAKSAGAEQVVLVGQKFNWKQSATVKALDRAKERGIIIQEGFRFKGTTTDNGTVTGLTLLGEGGIEVKIPCEAAYASPVLAREKAPDIHGIFVARQNRSGGANVIAAAAEGAKLAAQADRFLRGENASISETGSVTVAKREAVLARAGSLPLETGHNLLITCDDEAIAEASRCLGCGCGEGCQLCKTICTDFAPYTSGRDTICIDEKVCVACGMCFNRCPNGNIEMVNTGEVV